MMRTNMKTDKINIYAEGNNLNKKFSELIEGNLVMFCIFFHLSPLYIFCFATEGYFWMNI